jgi:Electron transfer DM13
MWMSTKSFLRNYKVSIPAAVVLVGLAAWLAFGYFAIHKAVIDVRVNQAAPSFDEPSAVTIDARGNFVSGEHHTSGVVTVLGNDSSQRFLRFEDFETSNGPDVNVYLVNGAAGISDHVDLGDLSGNIGNQNYEIPDSVDLGTYDTVVIWCVRFSVAFGQARLAEP